MYSSLLVLLLTLIATGNCEIKCYTTDPIKEEETCVAANNVCYEASSKDGSDDTGVCKIMRGCLKQTFTYAQSDNFEANLFANLKKTPSLFSVCNTEKCNNKPPNCDITDLDQENTNLEKQLKDANETIEEKRQEIATLNQQLNAKQAATVTPSTNDKDEQKVADDGSAVTGGIIGGIIGLIFGVVLGAGLLWFLKVKDTREGFGACLQG